MKPNQDRELSSNNAVSAWIGLGSNMGDRRATLDAAVAAINAAEHIIVDAVSEFRETKPVGPVAQPDFLNAVARVKTTRTASELFSLLQAIEWSAGRDRAGEERWGPRTLDLDLLIFGSEQIDSERLTIPHPRMSMRAFVLEPLADLDPDLVPPGQSATVVELLRVVLAAGASS